jgi:Arc/MetJ-type ribon-helix-helix transcriptional regulator
MNKEYGEVKIPREILRKIEERIKETEFESVDAYVTFVLEEVIKEVDEEEPDEVLSEEDEKKVKERLKALGYLD